MKDERACEYCGFAPDNCLPQDYEWTHGEGIYSLAYFVCVLCYLLCGYSTYRDMLCMCLLCYVLCAARPCCVCCHVCVSFVYHRPTEGVR